MKSLLRLSLLIALSAVVFIARADAPQTHFSDGFELLKGGKAKEAAAKFEAGLKADPKNALAHYYLGEAYLALKRDSEAKKEFQRSIDLDAKSSVSEKAKDRLAQLSPSSHSNTKVQSSSADSKGPSGQETVAFVNELMECEADGDLSVSAKNILMEFKYEYWQSVSLDGATLTLQMLFRVINTASYTDGDSGGNEGAGIGIGTSRMNLSKLNLEISEVETVFSDARTATTKHQQAMGKVGKTSIDRQIFQFAVSCLGNAECIESLTKAANRTYFNPANSGLGTSQKSVTEWKTLSRDGFGDALHDEPEKVAKAKELLFFACDEDKANRMRRALAHLIQISGGKKAPPPLF